MNPLKSVHGTIALGFVTAIIIMLVVGGVGDFNTWSFAVWLHVFLALSGLVFFITLTSYRFLLLVQH